ncbi:Low temperature viability protein [Piedraia hortae CBS 480.64]|uniref:Low temperature viability protein n=1 Tax=Piedraia hortae CBS 480.64 TaxID=1314780 RepID=A0A6A7C334_9PEZI|nr:Low temperature viability protein [Piedraia hortae CBS 480.64]
MPRKCIDKKTATTYQVVHRSQQDPLIHDDDVSQMVFAEKATKRVRQRRDLEEEFGPSIRSNEGEAAQHGVFFDDSSYDYMQHMRDLGNGGGSVTWVEAPATKQKKIALDDALSNLSLTESTTSERIYQSQQNVPDDIKGFQLDMDPRLREVLEALEDEEYVDDGEEDLFKELTMDRTEVSKDEWERLGEQQLFQDEDDRGWESDDTIRGEPQPPITGNAPENVQAPTPADPTNGAWLKEFRQFKAAGAAAPPSEGPSMVTSYRHKKRKGAKTNPSTFSMSSASVPRTEQHKLLDERFDRMLEKDELDWEGSEVGSMVSGMSSVSQLSRYSAAPSYCSSTDPGAAKTWRPDLDDILDGYLSKHSRAGKGGRRIKRFGPQEGMEQLDEIRKGLGPAKVK